MAEQEEPIISFQTFRETLESFGITIQDSEGGYREIKPDDVTIKDLEQGKLKITSKGIFNVDLETGEEQRVFLYKMEYDLNSFGKPRYHICKCQTIISFMNSDGSIPEYRMANSEPVPVRDFDFIPATKSSKYSIDKPKGTRIYKGEKQLSNLPLCKYCAKLIGDSDCNTTSTAFVEILRKAQPAKKPSKDTVKVDVNGNTSDWQKISTAFLRKHNFTCDKCGIKVSPFDRDFIQVHHKNKDKTNNESSNLRCLCIKCHSEIDLDHRKAFSNETNKKLIEAFLQKYKPVSIK